MELVSVIVASIMYKPTKNLPVLWEVGAACPSVGMVMGAKKPPRVREVRRLAGATQWVLTYSSAFIPPASTAGRMRIDASARSNVEYIAP
jgi:hypothetical protein